MSNPEVKEALTAHEQIDQQTEAKLAVLAAGIQKEHPEQKLLPEYQRLLKGQTGAA